MESEMRTKLRAARSIGRRRGARLAALVLVAMAAVSCTRGEPTPRGVVLIVLDTLRADGLSAYGNPRATSPRIDALAAEGVLFERAYSNASWTLPAFVGLLTGSYPSAAVFQGTRLVRSLVEPLRAAGFATAAFTEGGYVSPHFGMERGFDTFRSLEGKIQLHGVDVRPGDAGQGGLERTFESARGWLREHAEQPFFLLIHTYEVHMPYLRRTYAEGMQRGILGEVYSFDDARRVRSEPVGDTEVEYVRALYDGGVAAADREVGRTLDLLGELGVADRTLVVLTSDHGEELGEREPLRLGMHGHALYDSLLHVPLIVRDPTRAGGGRRVSAQVRLVDVMPTILDRLGVAVPGAGDGRSLLPLLDDAGAEDRPVYAEMLHPNSVTPLIRRVALRDGRWKLIVNAPPLAPGEPPAELYDVVADALETNNLAARQPDTKQALAERLRIQREAIQQRGLAGVDHGTIGNDVREQLRALGYLE